MSMLFVHGRTSIPLFEGFWALICHSRASIRHLLHTKPSCTPVKKPLGFIVAWPILCNHWNLDHHVCLGEESMISFARVSLVMVVASMLAACGGGGSGSNGTATPYNAQGVAG